MKSLLRVCIVSLVLTIAADIPMNSQTAAGAPSVNVDADDHEWQEFIPHKGEVVLQFPCPPAAEEPEDLAYGQGYLWLSSMDQGIFKLNPSDGSVVSWFPTPNECIGIQGLGHDGEYLWAAAFSNNIYQIDPSDGSIIKSIPAPGGSYLEGLDCGDGYLWISRDDQTIYKIDPSNGDVLDLFPTGSYDSEGLAYGGGFLWEGGSSSVVYKINPNTGSIIGSFVAPGSDVHGLAWDGAFLWSDSAVTKMIYKIRCGVDFTSASKNLSKSPGMTSRFPKVVSVPGTDSIFAIWVESSGDSDALNFSKSINGGQTWTAPLALSNLDGQILGRLDDLEDNYAISLDVDDPYVHVVMQKRSSVSDDFEIFYKRSTNLGGTWGSWAQLTVNTANSMYPHVAAESGYVHIAYQDAWPGNNEIMYKRILNNGGGAVDQTRRLTFASGDSCFPRIAVSENGDTVHIVHEDDATGQSQIYYKHLDTFGSGAYFSRQLTSSVSWSGLPDIAVSTGQDDQYVYIIYQALWPGNREIMYKRLGNYGHVGGSLYTARLTYSTSESRSGAIFFDPDSNSVHVTYHDNCSGNYDVMYRNLADYGKSAFTGKRVSWGTGDSSFATLSGSSGLIYVIWSDNTSGNYEILLKKSN